MTNLIITQKGLYDSVERVQSVVDALSTFAAMSPEEDDITSLLTLVSNGVYNEFEQLKKQTFSILKYLPEEGSGAEGEG